MSVSGLPEMNRALQAVRDRLLQGAATGSFVAANEIMTEAKERCPVDTGTLRGSGYVEAPVVSETGVTVELGFGGPAAPYAVLVHEKTEARHPVGEAKFFENAVNAQSTKAPQTIADHMKAALGGS